MVNIGEYESTEKHKLDSKDIEKEHLSVEIERLCAMNLHQIEFSTIQTIGWVRIHSCWLWFRNMKICFRYLGQTYRGKQSKVVRCQYLWWLVSEKSCRGQFVACKPHCTPPSKWQQANTHLLPENNIDHPRIREPCTCWFLHLGWRLPVHLRAFCALLLQGLGHTTLRTSSLQQFAVKKE